MSSLEQYLAVKTRDRFSNSDQRHSDTVRSSRSFHGDTASSVASRQYYSSASVAGSIYDESMFADDNDDHNPDESDGHSNNDDISYHSIVSPFRRNASSNSFTVSHPGLKESEHVVEHAREHIESATGAIVLKESWLMRRNSIKMWRNTYAQLQKTPQNVFQLILFKDMEVN